MMNCVLFSRFSKNAVLVLALVFLVFPVKNAWAAGANYLSTFRPPTIFSKYRVYPSYLNELKPYQKGFTESLKEGKTINDVAITLMKPFLTFNDLEGLFKKSFNANPICFSQGGAPIFPPGRTFSAPLCWDTPKQGCRSCACQCGYTGYIWDPTTSICGCAQ